MWMFLLTALAAPLPFGRCVDNGRLGGLEHREIDTAMAGAFLDPGAALPTLERIGGAWPGCDAVWMARAGLLHALGRRSEALAALRRAEQVALGPEAQRALALALHGAGEGGDTLASAAASTADPLLLRLAAGELPLSERVDALLAAVEQHPTEIPLLLEAITTLRDAGRPREAVERGRAWLEVVESPELAALVGGVERPFLIDDTRRIQRPAEYRTLDDGTEEVVVYSPALARRALEERLAALGYTEGKEVNGGTRYRSERPVSPWVEIRDDGTVEVQKSGKIKPAKLPDGRTMIPSISEKKLRPDRIRVMEAIAYEMSVWQQARTLQTFQQTLDERLPVQLTALWEAGEPLFGEGVLATQAERRDAMVAYWSGRACNQEGQAARTVVERFLRNVVQESPAALTGAQQAAVASSCPNVRLDL